jgi:hypothetical protein
MTKEDTIQQIVSKYGTTHIVLSFGAADGGAMFAQWLQREIMQRKGYTQPNNVYLDTLALDRVPGTRFVMKEIRPTAGGLASLNEDWNEYYRYAMSTAHTMIFVATAAWFSSFYCRRELHYFIAENQTREQQGQRRLSGVALTFSESGTSSDFAGMVAIPTTKRYVVADKKRGFGLVVTIASSGLWTRRHSKK